MRKRPRRSSSAHSRAHAFTSPPRQPGRVSYAANDGGENTPWLARRVGGDSRCVWQKLPLSIPRPLKIDRKRPIPVISVQRTLSQSCALT